MSWHALIIANTVLAAISYVIYRAAARRYRSSHQALSINASFYIFQYLGELIILPFLNLGHLQFGKVDQFWLWLIGGGLGFALANFFLYKLLTHVEAGLSSILGTLNVIFTIIFASLVLHEDLTSSQAVGALVLFFSIVYALMVIRKPGSHRRSPKAWFWGLSFALLAGIFYGAAAVNEKFLIGHMNLSTYMVFGWLGQVLMAVIMALIISKPSGLKKIFTNRKTLSLSITGGATRGLAGLFFLLALTKANNVAVVTVVSNFRLILIVLLGALILKEKQRLREKVLASLVAMAALAIIFWA